MNAGAITVGARLEEFRSGRVLSPSTRSSRRPGALMHTDYQAVARQLEWLADGLHDCDASQDLKALARNVRLLGVMTRVLVEARRRRRELPVLASAVVADENLGMFSTSPSGPPP